MRIVSSIELKGSSCDYFPPLDVRGPLTFYILVFFSRTLDRTWMWCYFDGALPKLCPVALPKIQDSPPWVLFGRKIGNLWKSSKLLDVMKPRDRKKNQICSKQSLYGTRQMSTMAARVTFGFPAISLQFWYLNYVLHLDW